MLTAETRWSVNESLLQSYRSIFISSQSFLLAVGAVTFDRYAFLNIILAVMSLVMIWWIWLPVVTARRRIVDYYKFSLSLTAEQQLYYFEHFTEGQYVSDGKSREQVNDYLENTLQLTHKITDMRETREKVDFWLPFGFSIIWLFFLIPSGIGLLNVFFN